LNYLATRPKLPSFVVQALVLLFAKITKQGWFDGEKDSYAFRNVVSDISVFLQVIKILGLIILGYIFFLLDTSLKLYPHKNNCKH
jgi:hypothetical protein